MTLHVPRLAEDAPLARAVFFALAIAIFSLSLQDDWDLEIFVSQTTHTFVGKVSKNSRENHGGQGDIVPAATVANWTPSFEPSSLAVADQQNLPAPYLLDFIAVRAPPVFAAV